MHSGSYKRKMADGRWQPWAIGNDMMAASRPAITSPASPAGSGHGDGGTGPGVDADTRDFDLTAGGGGCTCTTSSSSDATGLLLLLLLGVLWRRRRRVAAGADTASRDVLARLLTDDEIEQLIEFAAGAPSQFPSLRTAGGGTLPADVEQTFEKDGSLDGDTEQPLAAGEEVLDVDFGYQAPAVVDGVLFEDLDGMYSEAFSIQIDRVSHLLVRIPAAIAARAHSG